MSILTYAMLAMLAYMIIRILILSKRNKMNKRMLAVLDTFNNDEDGTEFFSKCDAFFEENRDNAEYIAKVRVLRLWGDAYHEKKEDFKSDLEQLDLVALIVGDGKKKPEENIENNEDSFFYLYLAIPNRLNYQKNSDLEALYFEKLNTIQDKMNTRLVKVIGDANQQYYQKTGDHGKEFYQSVLDGDYAQYKYSRQLIGIYKNIVSAMMARIDLDESNEEGFNDLVPELRSFTNSRLGKRYLKELDITLPPEETEEEPANEETSADETATEEEPETTKETQPENKAE